MGRVPLFAELATICHVWTPPDRRRIDGKLGVVLFALLLAGPVWLILIHAGGGPGSDRIDVLEHLDPDSDWRCIVGSIEEVGLPGTGGSWDVEPDGSSGTSRSSPRWSRTGRRSPMDTWSIGG